MFHCFTCRKAAEQAKSLETIDPLAIWKDDEIPNEEDLIDKFDKRPTPKYEFFFKTMVGSEDVFLGMLASLIHLITSIISKDFFLYICGISIIVIMRRSS